MKILLENRKLSSLAILVIVISILINISSSESKFNIQIGQDSNDIKLFDIWTQIKKNLKLVDEEVYADLRICGFNMLIENKSNPNIVELNLDIAYNTWLGFKYKQVKLEGYKVHATSGSLHRELDPHVKSMLMDKLVKTFDKLDIREVLEDTTEADRYEISLVEIVKPGQIIQAKIKESKTKYLIIDNGNLIKLGYGREFEVGKEYIYIMIAPIRKTGAKGYEKYVHYGQDLMILIPVEN